MNEPICPSCGAAYHSDAAFCSRCGAPRPGAVAGRAASEVAWSGKDFELTAGAVGLFGRMLAMGVAAMLIVPAPWALCWFYTWLVEKVQGRHGVKLSFHGTPGGVWVLTTLYGVLFLGSFAFSAWQASAEEPSAWAEGGYQLVNNVASVVLGWLLFRWTIGNTALDGQRLTLTAGLAKYFGWMVLVMLSVLTIIGWAWAACAMYRWLTGTIEGAPGRFTFAAKGHQLLGRTLLYILFIIPLVTMPWAIRWYFAWFVEQFRFEEGGELAA